MGVTGLWKLIEPCGTPVPVETLEGKVLAVDISIWLHQVVKGFQDNKGSALANAHLLGLFHRLCKLLYYRVRPVFVFDGCAPQLKRETIARRQQQRTNLNSEADRIQVLLLQSLAKEKVVQQALGANASKLLLKSPSKRVDDKTEKSDDMFKLPDLLDAPGIVQDDGTDKRTEDESDWEDSSYTTNEDSSFDASNLRHSYNANLQSIDVRSEHFRKLPAEVRHEILVDIKETRKQSSWGRLHELPARSDDFSSFQMKRLLKRRAVQETIEEVQQEMGDNTLSFAELQSFLIDKGIVESTEGKQESKQISSDENTRYILVRDLKRKLIETEKKENNKEVPVIENDQLKEKVNEEISNEKEELPSTSKEKSLTNNLPRGDEYDTDLELAIAMSLEESTVYSQRDYDYDSDENLKLNRDQRKQLKNAAIGPARTYMLEYAGMNHEEVVGIMDKTQVHTEIEDFEDWNFETETEGEKKVGSIKYTNLIVCNDDKKNDLAIEISKENYKDLSLHVSGDSDTDSDLEEVAEEKCYVDDRKGTEIMLNLSQPITLEDDLFADIFKADVKDKKEEKLDFEKNVLNTEGKELGVRKKEGEVCTNVEKKPGEGTANISTLKMESTNALVILDELKKEIDNIKHIKLSNIEINAPTNVIEVSDEEVVEITKPITQTTHVIEILDSDDLNSNNKSPQLKTPSKRKVISEYFDTDYVIKRTPDKCKMSEEDVPKVKSPFFVNKGTPKSNRKRTADTDGKTTPSPKKQISKASKSLFADSTDKESDVLSEPSTKSASSSKDFMKDAANVLREEKSAAELQALALDLAKERHDLETERNRQDRMGMNISQRMNSECQELLQLFGIPYIVAPMEAEAQCAFLDVVQLTNGTITDDSDIWLFGGRTVYKNFFAQNKHVLEFSADEIEKSFSCDRKKLIQLACLVGSDYTTGVHGIGTVTALEILAAFSSMKDLNSDEVTTSSTSVLSTLARFRDWWMVNKNSTTPPGSSARLSLRKKLKNIELHDGFPSPAVVEAYLAPKVDESKDTFSWGSPDVSAIHEFTRKIFGWTQSKTDDILAPVIKKINEKKTQATIRNYFTVKSAISVRQLKVSKRVQSAINKMNFEETEESPDQVARQIKRNTKRVKRKPPTTNTKTDAYVSETVDVSKADVDLSLTASTSKNPPTKAQRPVRIPNTKELIPQREHNRQQLLKNNENAAAVLKNSKAKAMSGKKKRIA